MSSLSETACFPAVCIYKALIILLSLSVPRLNSGNAEKKTRKADEESKGWLWHVAHRRLDGYEHCRMVSEFQKKPKPLNMPPSERASPEASRREPELTQRNRGSNDDFYCDTESIHFDSQTNHRERPPKNEPGRLEYAQYSRYSANLTRREDMVRCQRYSLRFLSVCCRSGFYQTLNPVSSPWEIRQNREGDNSGKFTGFDNDHDSILTTCV